MKRCGVKEIIIIKKNELNNGGSEKKKKVMVGVFVFFLRRKSRGSRLLYTLTATTTEISLTFTGIDNLL